MRPASRRLLVGLVVAGTACAHLRGKGRTDTATVEIYVTNYYVLPVDVSAEGSGISYRMGTVLPGLTSRFVVRQALVGNGGMVEFVASPSDGARIVRSGRLLLAPGDIVDFEIATHLLNSVAVIRP